MNPDFLAELARTGGGTFIRAGTAQVDMADVYRQSVGQLERTEAEASTVKRATPRFQWFAGLALLLLLVECVIGDRRRFGTARGRALGASASAAAALVLFATPTSWAQAPANSPPPAKAPAREPAAAPAPPTPPAAI